jgi:hypothetical protein
MDGVKIIEMSAIENRSPGTLDYVASFTFEVRGIRIGGCLLARGDSGLRIRTPRQRFRRRDDIRNQIRFATIMDDDLREAVTAAARDAYMANVQLSLD